MKKIHAPLIHEEIKALKAGDFVFLTGTIYTARDAAHKRLLEIIKDAEIKKIRPALPFEILGQVIYYTGPAPARPGDVTGPSGPTTSYRMDRYTPDLLKYGLKGMIGKGERNPELRKVMKNYGAVYFAAVGGASVVLSQCIVKSEVIAFDNLGTEAVRKLSVKNLPLVVINDLSGRDLYSEAVKEFAK